MTRPGDLERLVWLSRPGDDPSPGATSQLRRFELANRGDRVTGALVAPTAGEGPFPLVLLAHTLPGLPSRQPVPLCAQLASQGLAVAQIDLPLYGARAEHKLAACVDAGWNGQGEMASLAREFATQSLSDLRHCLNALSQGDGLDAGRIAFLGIGLGGDLGAHFCAEDSRLRAVVLALAGERQAAPDLDPTAAVAKIAPRPLLLLDSGTGNAQRLHDAAGEPKTRHTLAAAGDLDRDDTRKVITRFLSEALGL